MTDNAVKKNYFHDLHHEWKAVFYKPNIDFLLKKAEERETGNAATLDIVNYMPSLMEVSLNKILSNASLCIQIRDHMPRGMLTEAISYAIKYGRDLPLAALIRAWPDPVLPMQELFSVILNDPLMMRFSSKSNRLGNNIFTGIATIFRALDRWGHGNIKTLDCTGLPFFVLNHTLPAFSATLQMLTDSLREKGVEVLWDLVLNRRVTIKQRMSKKEALKMARLSKGVSLRCLRENSFSKIVSWDNFENGGFERIEKMEVNFSSGTMDGLKTFLSKFTNVTCLDLSHNHYNWNSSGENNAVRDEASTSMRSALFASLPQLKRLNLSGNKLKNDDLHDLLKGAPHLEYLNASCNQLSDRDFRQIGELTVLEHLDISATNWKPLLSTLIEVLPALKRLKALEMEAPRNTYVNDDEFDSLLRLWRSLCPNLCYLNIYKVRLHNLRQIGRLDPLLRLNICVILTTIEVNCAALGPPVEDESFRRNLRSLGYDLDLSWDVTNILDSFDFFTPDLFVESIGTLDIQIFKGYNVKEYWLN